LKWKSLSKYEVAILLEKRGGIHRKKYYMVLSDLFDSVSIIAGAWRCGSCKISCWLIRTNFHDSKDMFQII